MFRCYHARCYCFDPTALFLIVTITVTAIVTLTLAVGARGIQAGTCPCYFSHTILLLRSAMISTFSAIKLGIVDTLQRAVHAQCLYKFNV